MKEETDNYALIFRVNHRLFLLPISCVMYIDNVSEITEASDTVFPNIFGICNSRGNTVKMISLENVFDAACDTGILPVSKPLIILTGYYGIAVDEILGLTYFGELRKTRTAIKSGTIAGIYTVNDGNDVAFELNVPQIVGE